MTTVLAGFLNYYLHFKFKLLWKQGWQPTRYVIRWHKIYHCDAQLFKILVFESEYLVRCTAKLLRLNSYLSLSLVWVWDFTWQFILRFYEYQIRDSEHSEYLLASNYSKKYWLFINNKSDTQKVWAFTR